LDKGNKRDRKKSFLFFPGAEPKKTGVVTLVYPLAHLFPKKGLSFFFFGKTMIAKRGGDQTPPRQRGETPPQWNQGNWPESFFRAPPFQATEGVFCGQTGKSLGGGTGTLKGAGKLEKNPKKKNKKKPR